ncbi:MAG: hypothetical protein WCW02_02295 [Candidatus Buchananbacteria bacterium]
MNILNNKEVGLIMPINRAFIEAASNLAKRMFGFAICSEGNIPFNPDKIACLNIRTLIEQGANIAKDQKYVLGIRFTNFGDLILADLASLDLPNHRDIVHEHGKILKELTVEHDDKFTESYFSPYVYVGGHLRINPAGQLEFFGDSGDFGGNFFGSDSNEVAAFFAAVCELPVAQSVSAGQEKIRKLLEFVKEHKRQKNFYELVIREYLKARLTGQNLAALANMKALDRQHAEGIGFFQALTEEIAGGGEFSGEIFKESLLMLTKKSS